MASLYIKDSRVAERAARIAERLGATKTEIVSRAFDALEAKLALNDPDRLSFGTRMAQWRKENPPLPPTGLTADKAFSDWLCGEEDVVDPFS